MAEIVKFRTALKSMRPCIRVSMKSSRRTRSTFVAKLHRAFDGRRKELLKARVERQARIDAGDMPDFLPETKSIRDGDWKIAPLPKALECRRVEITGPVERKMIINAFNSGADSYMADFEDSNSPNWFNQINGQVNLKDAIRREISFTNEAGKVYKLNDTDRDAVRSARAAGISTKST